jgi:hypothetical protein
MDGAILVVSAADGPMPQTREHILLARQVGGGAGGRMTAGHTHARDTCTPTPSVVHVTPRTQHTRTFMYEHMHASMHAL